jgi:hypothetical protein
MEKLIVGPFQTTRIQTVIVIDALDECRDEEPASAILSVLSRYVDQIPSVKFFITGRPEPRITSGFRLQSLQPITEVLRLHEVDRSSVDSDIKLFLRTRLTEIAKARTDCTFPPDWPSPSHLAALCDKAAGFFIYASTVVKFVASKSRTPIEQLDRIISLPQSTTHEGRFGIDPLYTQVLEEALNDVDADDEDRVEIQSRFKTVVGAVVLIFNPLSVGALSDLLKVSNIITTLSSLHSLLLPDFLTDPKRCKSQWFFIDPAIYHTKMLFSCLKLIGERLRRNICNIEDYAVLSEVEDLPGYKKKYMEGALGYACQFWTKHLLEIPKSGPSIEEVQRAIDAFFKTSLLYWMEALAIIGNLGIGAYSMSNIEQWYTSVSMIHPNQ